MNIAFGALAAQAGLDVRPALVASRSEVGIDPRTLADKYFVDADEIAIKAGDSWKLFNVSRRNLTPGLLPADEEGTFAVIADPKAAILQPTPVSPPSASSEMRTGTLKLSPKGTLSGDVTEGYSGHRAADYRSHLAGKSPAQRETYFHDRIIQMFPDSEITNLKIENIDDATHPLLISYHLDAPLFAQVTGKRILFEPNAFRRADAVLLSATERRYPIEFPYAWFEQDNLRIELPKGFSLENAEQPGDFSFGDAGEYKLSMKLQDGPATQLLISRELTFGAKGLIYFKAAVYPKLKGIFEEVRLRDTHSLSLREN
jgi:hypothetical protein